MNKKTVNCVLGLLFMSLVNKASAEVVNVSFQGVFPQYFLDGGGFLSRAGVNGGDILAGNFSYDTNATPWAGVDQYWPLSYSFSIGADKVSFNWSQGGNGIIVNNDTSFGDYVALGLYGNLINQATNETWGINTWQWVADRTKSILTNSSLADSLVLAALIDPSANPGYESFFRINSNGIDFTLIGHSWSIQEVGNVPIPGTFWLFVTAIVPFIGRRASKDFYQKWWQRS